MKDSDLSTTAARDAARIVWFKRYPAKQTLIAFLLALLATTAFSIDPAPVSSNAVLAIDPKARACCTCATRCSSRLPAIPTRSCCLRLPACSRCRFATYSLAVATPGARRSFCRRCFSPSAWCSAAATTSPTRRDCSWRQGPHHLCLDWRRGLDALGDRCLLPGF